MVSTTFESNDYTSIFHNLRITSFKTKPNVGNQAGHAQLKCRWVRALHSTLWSFWLRNLFPYKRTLIYRLFYLQLLMPLALLVLSRLARIQDMLLLPNAVLYQCLYIWYLIDGCSFLSIALQKNGLYRYRLWIVNLLSTNQSQSFRKFSLSRFFIGTTSLCWYRIHESAAHHRKADVTACGISLL